MENSKIFRPSILAQASLAQNLPFNVTIPARKGQFSGPEEGALNILELRKFFTMRDIL
ncbi:hypothetical protein BT96DRAFT_922088, partial [Gymnopus androsaceus JB14]